MLALRLPKDIEDRLEDLSKQTGRSKSFYAREAILAHLDDLEDYYLAEERLDALQQGDSEIISLDDVMKKHGVED
ncbi:TraY domain-containing protein [Neorhizobium lilium]|uniref:Relaxosome protein TraY n=1 Tax=Neorhizobium lilium TaxID=2503024 RepID=A0A444LDW7_9HYPH|nr:DUF6290 family protein [Neorhizobium lilium]RWX76033.1 TraY domain-containing protein [Neorhizobium lilium]